MQLIRFGSVFAVSLMLAACGGEEPASQDDMGVPVAGPSGESAEDAPEPIAQAAAPAVSEPSCPAEDGVFCRGPVTVRINRVMLSRGNRKYSGGATDVTGTATFGVKNRSESDVRFNVILKAPTDLVLANGVIISNRMTNGQLNGITPCRSDADDCVDSQDADFITLRAGESDAAISVSFRGTAGPDESKSLPRVEAADANLQLIVIASDGSREIVNATFSDVPVFNNFSN